MVGDVASFHRRREAAGRSYLEFLRVPSMSAGLYELPAGGVDGQQPHKEDEVYVVISGRAQFFDGEADVAVGPGTFLYVPAHREHRFHSITEDLSVFVVFAPPETR